MKKKEYILILKEKAISHNSAYPTNKQGRRFLIPEAKILKEMIGYKFIENYGKIRKNKRKKYKMSIGLSFADNRQRDVGNYNKIIKDALEGILYENDKQVINLREYLIFSWLKQDLIFIKIKEI